MKKAGKIFLDLFRESLTLWFFTFSISLTSFLILMIKNETVNLLLLLAVFALTLMMNFVLVRPVGEKHYRNTLSLQARDRYQKENGVAPDGNFKEHARFAPWKGFVITALVHIPLFVMLILKEVLSGKSAEIVETISIIAYQLYGGIIRLISVKANAWFMLICAVITITAGGAGYLWGGVRQIRIQNRIARRHNEIYGDIQK